MSFNAFIFALLFAVLYSMNMYADNIRITVEVSGVNLNSGSVHVEIYTNEQDHKREIPFATFVLESRNSTLVYEIDLPQKILHITKGGIHTHAPMVKY